MDEVEDDEDGIKDIAILCENCYGNGSWMFAYRSRGTTGDARSAPGLVDVWNGRQCGLRWAMPRLWHEPHPCRVLDIRGPADARCPATSPELRALQRRPRAQRHAERSGELVAAFRIA